MKDFTAYAYTWRMRSRWSTTGIVPVGERVTFHHVKIEAACH